jgi:hypothetical protein
MLVVLIIFSMVIHPFINRSRHLPMDERTGQFNSNPQVNYSECSYATPYVVEKEVTSTCLTPYASCNLHDSALMLSITVAELTNTHLTYTHLHMLL